MMTDGFVIRRVATSGCEVCDPDGNIVAWAADEPWAMLIAALLNRMEAEGLRDPFGVAGVAPAAP
jgi:hypothetical protein